MAKKTSRTQHKNVQDIETVIKNLSLGMNETDARVGTSITIGMRSYYKKTLSGLKQAVAHAKKHFKKVEDRKLQHEDIPDGCKIPVKYSICDSNDNCADVSKEAMNILDTRIDEWNTKYELQEERYKINLAIAVPVALIAGMLLMSVVTPLVG